MHSLSLRDRAVLVREQERFQVDNLLTKLRYLGAQVLVLGAVEFYLVLKARQPGLLALSALERSHPVTWLAIVRYTNEPTMHTCCAPGSFSASLHPSSSSWSRPC